MKKKLYLLVALALLLSATAFHGTAAPVTIEGDVTAHDSCCPADAAIARAGCPECGEMSFVYKCNGERRPTDTGTHLFGSCTVTYTTSRTIEYCNAECGEIDSYWHPFCDEYHANCGLGWYATCTIEYA